MHLDDLFEGVTPERIATGFQFTEGPVWHPEGYLLFSDIPANTIMRMADDGTIAPWRHPSGNANGLTYDRQGRLIACEHGNRRVSITMPDGEVQPLATHYEGKRLNSPNDVVVRSDGSIYFTDPPYGVREEERELPYSGVYRISPDGALELLVDDFERPNGLAFSPNEAVLYIDDTVRRQIRAFDVSADGGLSNGRIWADMASPDAGGPDGMKVDREGNVYCTGPGGLWVFTPGGECLGVIRGPEQPANLAFGGANLDTMYLTARTSLYRLRTKIPGMPVF
jgi:sugar lactone lactonase YvrE